MNRSERMKRSERSERIFIYLFICLFIYLIFALTNIIGQVSLYINTHGFSEIF